MKESKKVKDIKNEICTYVHGQWKGRGRGIGRSFN